MSKAKRGGHTYEPPIRPQETGTPPTVDDDFPEPSVETELPDEVEGVPPQALPVGFKELTEEEDASASEQTAALLDGWERRLTEGGEEEWINRRDFKVPGGAVPQGVTRSRAEAYALEVQRCG